MATEAGGWLHTSLCRMHLSFLLDLSGSGLEELLGSDCKEGSESASLAVRLSACSGERPPSGSSYSRLTLFSSAAGSSSNKKGKKAMERCSIFGAPITAEIMASIQPLLDFLIQPDNLQQEGLFRKTGQIGRQRTLRGHLVSAAGADDIQSELDSGQYSAHDVASLLKTFLGETPEPLLSERHYHAHAQIPELPQDKQMAAVQLLIQLLPAENVELLRQLMHLLSCVALEEKNRMTADTLGMLFAPHLMVPRKMAGVELQEVAPRIAKAIAFMISHPTEIFQVPEMLLRDLASSRKGETIAPPAVVGRDTSTAPRPVSEYTTAQRPVRYRRRAGTADNAVSTTISFADRQASLIAASETDTTVALAELYAHVSKLPESTKKRKILKQFTKANAMMSPTPEKNHKRSRSFGESLKKMVGRHTGHKRRGSSSSVSTNDIPAKKASPPLPGNQENQPPASAASHKSIPSIKAPLLPTSPSSSDSTSTRMLRLFKSKLRLQQDECQSESKQRPPVIRQRLSFHGSPTSQQVPSPALSLFKQALKQQQKHLLPSSPKVHIVDMAQESESHGPLASHSRHYSDLPATSPCMSIHRADQIPDGERPLHTSPPPARHRLRNALRSRKSPIGPMALDRRLEQPDGFVSPMTRTMQRFPVSTKVHMMTPGSRKPMAVLHTP